MHICWIPAILLFFFLCSTANVICSHTLDDLSVVRVYVNGTTAIGCPNLRGKVPEERLYILCLGDVQVGSHSYDSSHTSNETIREGLRVKVNQSKLTVQFILSGITLEQAGVYTCKAQDTYPPPIKEVKEMTVVLVQDYQCPAGKNPVCGGDDYMVWVWKLAFWISLVFSLAVILIALMSCLRLRKGEGSHSDYMNTIPRAPPRVLKKGVQHPVRMGRY